MFLDNVSLSVQSQDLKSGTESIKQDSEEERSTSRSECIGSRG
jgi:hypothetical protein